MYVIVHEKEERLVAFMRMNGMKMSSYWISNFFFDWLLFLAAIIVFLIVAILFLDLHTFEDSGLVMQIIFYVGYGYS